MPSSSYEPYFQPAFRVAIDNHPIPPRRSAFNEVEVGDIIGLQDAAWRVERIETLGHGHIFHTRNVRSGFSMTSYYDEGDHPAIALFWRRQELSLATPPPLTGWTENSVILSIGEFWIRATPTGTLKLSNMHRKGPIVVMYTPDGNYGDLLRSGLRSRELLLPVTGVSVDKASGNICGIHCQRF